MLQLPTKKKDDALVDFLKKKRYLYFRGSEDDVLKRFVVGAQKEKPNLIVRITADCPLVDAKIVDTVIKRAIESNAEYTSNTLKLTYPDGYDVEVVKYSILKKVARLTHNKQDREHVTRYIRHNVEKFDTQNVEAPKDMQYSKWRLCLDTQKDFELIKKIFSFFPHHYIIHYEDVVTLFNKHKELQTLNQ